MQALKAVALVISALALTGCPSEFGKDGRIAKAVEKDSKEHLLEITQCADLVRERVCAPGKEHSPECLRCGGPP